jgi:hypothetical protein
MLIRVRLDLSFNLADQAQVDALRESLVPFAAKAVNVKQGTDNEERGFISIEHCGHDQTPPAACKVIAMWEVGKGGQYELLHND